MNIVVILLMSVNLMTGDTWYDQYSSMQECKQVEDKIKKDIMTNAKVPMLVIECAEYDIELPTV